MIRRPPRSTPLYSSAASDVYKRQDDTGAEARTLGGILLHPADAVVLDDKLCAIFALGLDSDPDLPGSLRWIGVFIGVGDEFRHDHPDRDGLVGRHLQVLGREPDRIFAPRFLHR